MKQPTCHFKKIIGIDPGKSGGICIIEDNKIMKAYKCPDDTHSMFLLFNDMIQDTSISSVAVFIEKVWARPSDGRVSVFTFAQNYGHWEAIIASKGILPEYVVPSVWMKHFEVPKGLTKKDRKNHIKGLAIKMTSVDNEYSLQGKVTLATADAIIIAKYGIDKAS